MKKRIFPILFLVLTGCGWERFNYGFDSLEPNDQSSQATSLDGTVNATINPRDWTDYYKFDATTGEKVRLRLDLISSGNVEEQADLLDSSRLNASPRILTNELFGPGVVIELSKSQTYFLRVSGHAAKWEGIITGFNDEFTQLEYSLSLERNPAQPATIKF